MLMYREPYTNLIKLPAVKQEGEQNGDLSASGPPLTSPGSAASLSASAVNEGTTKKYQCGWCTYEADSQYQIQRHRLGVHVDVRPFSCSFCPHKSKSKRDIDSHVRAVHEKIRDFQCEHCDYAAFRKAQVVRHIRNAHKNVIFEADLATADDDKEPTVVPAAGDHLPPGESSLSVSLPKKKFQCGWCAYEADTKYQVQRHRIGVHVDVRPFACNWCPHKSKTKRDIESHVRAVHEKLRDFNCKLCEYKAFRKSQIKEHMKKTHGLDMADMESAAPRNVAPNQAVSAAGGINSIAAAMAAAAAASAGPRKKFQCGRCAYEADTQFQVRRHIQGKHMDVRPYPCNWCSHRSKTKRDIEHHVRAVHEKIRDFKCDLCEFKAFRKSQIKLHAKRVHGTSLSSSPVASPGVEDDKSKLQLLQQQQQQQQQQQLQLQHSQAAAVQQATAMAAVAAAANFSSVNTAEALRKQFPNATATAVHAGNIMDVNEALRKQFQGHFPFLS